MCSTNNGSDDGGGGEGSYGLSSTSKKPPKRQRLPKRGPGVAELEKILREQEKNSSSSGGGAHIPYFHHISRPHIDGHFLRMPSISSPLASMSTTNPSSYSSSFGTSTTTPVPNSNYGSANGCTNVDNALVRRCIHGELLPEREFFPVAWAADEGKSEEGGTPLPSRLVTKMKQHCENPTSMTNNYPGSGSSSSNIPSSVQIEPPSSQRLCHNYSSIGPHDKVIGLKRPALPSSNNNIPPICDYPVPQVPSHRHRPDQPTTSFNHGIGYDPNLTKPTPRDAKWDIPPVESNYLPNYNTELHGPHDGNFFRFLNPPGTAAVLPPFKTLQLQLPKYDLIMPFQGSIKESNQSPKVAGPDDQNKPFYSFLPSKEPANETLQDLSIERGDKEEDDGIDLNLKLSTS